MYRYVKDVVKIIKPENVRSLTNTQSKRAIWSASKISLCENCVIKNGASQKKSFHTNYGRFYLLGFLGLFESQEEEVKETIDDKILLTIKRAILAIERDEVVKAERYLHTAYEMSTEEHREDVKTQIIDMQANLCLHQGDFKRAETLFKIAIQRMVQDGMATAKDNSVVEISIKLSEIYKNTARYAEAEVGYQYCVDVQREKIEKKGQKDEDTLLLAAWALHGLAQMYLSQNKKNRIEESMELIKAAYKYATDASGFDSQQALVLQSDVATTMALLGDFENALKTIRECATTAKNKHKDLYATLQVNTGTILLQKGDAILAEQVCREAQMTATNANDQESLTRALECVKKASELNKKKK